MPPGSTYDQEQGLKLINRRLATIVIFAALSIGLLLRFMAWRIQEIGVDGVSVLMGLVAIGILIVAGMAFYRGLCSVPDKRP